MGREKLDIQKFGRESLEMGLESLDMGRESLDIQKFGRESLDIQKFGRESLDMGRESPDTDFRDPYPDFPDQILACPDFRGPRRDTCADFSDSNSRRDYTT